MNAPIGRGEPVAVAWWITGGCRSNQLVINAAIIDDD